MKGSYKIISGSAKSCETNLNNWKANGYKLEIIAMTVLHDIVVILVYLTEPSNPQKGGDKFQNFLDKLP